MNRIKFLQKIVLTASVSLAMAFTVSCSDDKDDDTSTSSSSITTTGGDGSSSSIATTGGDGSSSSIATTSGESSSSAIDGYTGSYGSLEYEGKSYKTVVIGTQTWMAENLNYAVTGSKCYENDPANCEIYGLLYDWATAMKLPAECATTNCSDQIESPHQGICPDGWHLPDYVFNDEAFAFEGELKTFTNFVGASSVPKLKATSLWTTSNGTDILGFGALPGGWANATRFFDLGTRGSWWGASEHSSSETSAYYIQIDNTSVGTSNDSKALFRSVRCLQNP